MTGKTPSFTFGIEEEYLLVDRETRDLAEDTPRAMIQSFRNELGKAFSREYIASQIEVCTPVCSTMAEGRESLARSRAKIARIANRFNLAPIAAATHPFARWGEQAHTDLPRYNSIADDFQGVGRRMIVNGLHVHVGIADNETRIRLMNELRPLLPILLALSTSSPFWQGENTGLKSFRTAINDSTPRKGIPETFASWKDYQSAIAALARAGVIEDATKIWWDVRPSANFPTLEMRITDVTPLLDDTMCIVALFRCFCRNLSRGTAERPSPLSRIASGAEPQYLALINENRWRAQRYGTDEGLIDFSTGRVASLNVILDDVLAAIRVDAEHFGCVAEVEHARTILNRGTGAHRQVACYRRLREQGRTVHEALIGVVDQLVAETAAVGGMVAARAVIGNAPDYAHYG